MKNAEDVAEKITYNVIESICHVVDRNIYSESILKKVSPDVAKALQDAYQKGAEEMRARAAKTSQESWDRPGDVIYVSEVRHKEPYVTGKEWCDHVARRIRALPLTEGGAR